LRRKRNNLLLKEMSSSQYAKNVLQRENPGGEFRETPEGRLQRDRLQRLGGEFGETPERDFRWRDSRENPGGEFGETP
jgi:hypothetical protein